MVLNNSRCVLKCKQWATCLCRCIFSNFSLSGHDGKTCFPVKRFRQIKGHTCQVLSVSTQAMTSEPGSSLLFYGLESSHHEKTIAVCIHSVFDAGNRLGDWRSQTHAAAHEDPKRRSNSAAQFPCSQKGGDTKDKFMQSSMGSHLCQELHLYIYIYVCINHSQLWSSFFVNPRAYVWGVIKSKERQQRVLWRKIRVLEKVCRAGSQGCKCHEGGSLLTWRDRQGNSVATSVTLFEPDYVPTVSSLNRLLVAFTFSFVLRKLMFFFQ